MNGQRRASAWPSWPLVVILVAQAAALYLPPLLSVNVFGRDAQQHVWWTYRFADPSLFPNDPIADFFSRPAMAPAGVQAIYRMFVPWVDAQVLSELLPFVLAIATSVMAWLVGRQAAGGNREGGTVAAIFAAFVLFPYLDGGTANTFAQPLLLLGLWSLMSDRPGWLGASILLSALLYPPVGLIIGASATALAGARAIRGTPSPAGGRWLLVPALLAIAVTAGVYAKAPADRFGPAITVAEARSAPEFGPQGRVPYYTDDAIAMYVEGTRAGLGLDRYAFAGLAALFAFGAWRFRWKLPLEATALAAASLGLFVVAHLLSFALHVPNRYVRYSFPVLIMLCLAAWLPRLGPSAPLNPPGLGRRMARSAVPWMVLGLLVAAAHLARSASVSAPDRDLESAYAFLSAMPKDTLIAAHPRDADAIPLRTRRSVLVGRETALPFFVGYYRPMAERTRAVIAALYASDWAFVDDLHERYGADVFLVNRQRYRVQARENLDEPFRGLATEGFSRNLESGFVLNQPPAQRVLFECGDYLVVQLGR